MRAFWVFVRKDLLRLLRDPASLAVWIAVPFSVLALIALVFGGSGAPVPKEPLYIVDHDGSVISRAVPMAFSQGPMQGMFEIVSSEESAARQKMEQGKGAAAVIIPAGFGQAALSNRPATLLLITNPSQRLLPRIAEEVLVLGADALHYLHMVAGAELQSLAGLQSAPSFETVQKISGGLYRTIEQVRPLVDPPLIDYEIRLPPAPPKPTVDFRALFLAGMLFLSLLFIARGASGDLWVEHRQGTLRRVATTYRSLTVFLAGKMAAALLLCSAVSILAVLLARLAFGLVLQQLPLALTWMFLASGAFYTLMGSLQLIPNSEAAGDIATSLVLFPMAVIGGSFFPLEMLPASIARIGRLTPLGWSISWFRRITLGEAAPGQVVLPALMLAVAAGLLFLVMAALVRRRLIRG